MKKTKSKYGYLMQICYPSVRLFPWLRVRTGVSPRRYRATTYKKNKSKNIKIGLAGCSVHRSCSPPARAKGRSRGSEREWEKKSTGLELVLKSHKDPPMWKSEGWGTLSNSIFHPPTPPPKRNKSLGTQPVQQKWALLGWLLQSQ